jgi:hypothetical protein
LLWHFAWTPSYYIAGHAFDRWRCLLHTQINEIIITILNTLSPPKVGILNSSRDVIFYFLLLFLINICIPLTLLKFSSGTSVKRD